MILDNIDVMSTDNDNIDMLMSHKFSDIIVLVLLISFFLLYFKSSFIIPFGLGALLFLSFEMAIFILSYSL